MVDTTVPVDAPLRVALLPALTAVGAGAVWSLGALFARLAKQTDAWQYLLWRSIGVIAVMEVIGLRRGLGSMTIRAYRSGVPMIIGNAMLLLASLGFVYAIKNTTAANASFLASLTPLLAVILSRVILGERLTRVTVGALVLATTGLLITVLSDLGAGNMTGNVAAIVAALGFAGYTVCVRSSTERDWSPILPGYALAMIVLCALVCLAQRESLVPSLHDIVLALVHGGVIIVVGTIMFNAASREVPAVAMTVFAQSEMVMVPLWMLVVLAEVPTAPSLIGGAIILTAVIGKVVLDARATVPVEPGPGSFA